MKNNYKENNGNLNNKLSNSKVLQRIEDLVSIIKKKIEKSIRFELMMVIGVCFLLSFIFYSFTNNLLKREYPEPKITYDYDSIERKASELSKQIESEENLTLKDKSKIDKILESVSSGDKSYITDLDGKVLYKTRNVVEENIDIYSALKSAMTNVDYEKVGEVKEKNYIMPLKVGGERIYLIYSKIPEATITYNIINTSNSSLALLLTVCRLVKVMTQTIVKNTAG